MRWREAIDIAGPATAKEARYYQPKGATGCMVRTLLGFLEQVASLLHPRDRTDSGGAARQPESVTGGAHRGQQDAAGDDQRAERQQVGVHHPEEAAEVEGFDREQAPQVFDGALSGSFGSRRRP